MQTCSQTRIGRVLLHTLCILKRPENFRWHWQGIRREFSRGAATRAA